ncbi:MBL fold metallo-hydrolase [Sphingorhabdus sp.]|uniref:MBL fold metallo-hydrolase n=1 Tax=Sphingorhabdus sp. TaxID=1902408 RepID=UPI00391A1F89
MRYLLASAALIISAPVLAQQDLSKVEIKAEQIAPGVAVLFGAGGNIGVSYGEDGTVLIDDQFAPLTGKIQAAVAALGAQPVKFLVNTHWHYDHTGGNENLGKAGAVIMAHDNVRVRMAAGQGNQKPSAKAALPVVTYADGLKLHLNGEEVRVIHMPAGHTDGDSIVHWTKSNVIHMGDLFFLRMSFPFVDASSGGHVRGVISAADKALAIADDQTTIIPGHGEVATKADLQQYRDMIAQIVAKVEASIKAGKTLEQVKAERPADGYGVKADGFITADRFVETVYNMVK